jgi:hypothetical protein
MQEKLIPRADKKSKIKNQSFFDKSSAFAHWCYGGQDAVTLREIKKLNNNFQTNERVESTKRRINPIRCRMSEISGSETCERR